jgi:ABC-2 type transport system permease protein
MEELATDGTRRGLVVNGDSVRYATGEAAQTMVNLSDVAPEIAKRLADAENLVIIAGAEGVTLDGSQALMQACANFLIESKHYGKAPFDFERFEFITYREYVGVSTALLLFVALTAPDVVCPDRAQRVLPLLFARPLTGNDYVLAKVGAIATIVFGFAFLPQVVLFVGQALVSDGALDYMVDNAAVLWQVPVSVAVLAVYYAAIGVALASLTDRRIVGGVAVLALALITSAVAGILTTVADGSTPLAVLNVLALPLEVRDLVFLGHISRTSDLSGVPGGGLLAVGAYVLVLGACLATLQRRYREVAL